MNRKHRVLVVDDDSFNLSIMEEILSDHYDLLMATTGEECLELAHGFRPALVLLDIMLPGIDGYETCRRLREDPNLRYTKVILVSAKVQLDERLEGYDSQADDYITKPFDADELLAKVRVMLRLQYAEELDEFKGQFLHLLAHETRTPLTGILAPAQLLRDSDEVTAEERQEMSGIIFSSAQSLVRLVQGTVELCAFKAGRAVLEEQPVVLATIVERIISDLQSQSQAKSIEFMSDLSAQTLVNVDEHKLAHALRTLLENAVEHGNTGSKVMIRLADQGQDVTVEVENEGDPLTPEELPYVFEAFRVHDIDHYSRGVGIDLALAREIALAHGGDIECRVASENSMVFRLSLPVCRESDVGEPVGAGTGREIRS